jgi:hypothetical protein
MEKSKPTKSKKKNRDKHQNEEGKLKKQANSESKAKKKKSKAVAETKPDVELPAPSYRVTWIPLDDIKVDPATRCRPVIPGVVKTLVDGIPKDGLRTPLTIRWLDGVAHLVAGWQRLAALKTLEWDEAPCVCENDELAAQRWQITENLHRGELTKLQRANQTAALLALPRDPAEISGEKVQKKKRGRPEGGDAKAARTLNVRGKTADAKRKNIAEDRQISDIHEDAQQALVDAGLDDNGKALREVADEPTREAQLAKVRALMNGSGNNGPSTSGDDADETDDGEPLLAVLKRAWRKAKALQAVWQKASMEDRRYFIIEDLGYPLDEEAEADDDEYDDDHQD